MNVEDVPKQVNAISKQQAVAVTKIAAKLTSRYTKMARNKLGSMNMIEFIPPCYDNGEHGSGVVVLDWVLAVNIHKKLPEFDKVQKSAPLSVDNLMAGREVDRKGRRLHRFRTD